MKRAARRPPFRKSLMEVCQFAALAAGLGKRPIAEARNDTISTAEPGFD